MRKDKSPVRKAVFLDRDGTLNLETGYLHHWEDWQWLPGVKAGLQQLHQAGYILVIVSNQSGIARGYYTETAWRQLAEHINLDLLDLNVSIDGFYFCPHHPAFTGECQCRKPAPGMILKAAEDLCLNLAASWLIGDKVSDINAAIAAGCSPILVETGYGKTEKEFIPATVPVCENFSAAVNRILQYGNQLS